MPAHLPSALLVLGCCVLGSSTLAAGCGGRDQLPIGPLPDDDGSTFSGGGEGGFGGDGGAGGDGGSGGEGGEGGAPDDCPAIVFEGPMATASDGMGMLAGRGELTFVGSDFDTVALVGTFDPLAGPGATQMRHTAVEPWLTWPDDGLLEPGHLVAEGGFTRFGAARGIVGRFAITLLTPGGLTAGIDYVAHEAIPSQIGGVIAADAETLLDTGHGVSAYLETKPGGERQLEVVLPYNSDGGFKWGGPFVVGCTAGDPLVAVAGTYDGSLFATSQGSGIGISCAQTNAGPRQGLVTGRTGIVSSQLAVKGNTITDANPTAMELVTDGNGGGWLFWQDESAPLTVRAQRLTEDAGLSGSEVTLADISGSWTAHASGPHLWLASVTPDNQLTVWRYATDGELTGTASTEAAAAGDSQPSMVSWPDGTRAVVAFTENGAAGSELRMARFACLPPDDAPAAP